MIYKVPMPSLGADMDQGKLMDWKIGPGDNIKKGQIIALVETTKSTVEIESFRDGKVLALIANVGDQIAVGSPIATLEVEVGEDATSAMPARVKISPAARKLAYEKKLDITKIVGSGELGEIELKDIEALGSKETSKSNLREAIAKAMSRSKKEIPHYYLKSQFSLDLLIEWIDKKNKELLPEKRLLVPVVLFKAVLETLKENPEMNGYYKNGNFEPIESIHLGIAIALKSGGVLVPAILDAQKMSLHELNSSFQDLALRTSRSELKNRELTEGTVTITNIGDLGTDEVFGIIFPPQVSIIGLGRIHKTPVIDKDIIRTGFVINITLSADHRVTDGLAGAHFLAAIDKKLQNPNLLE